MILIIDINVLLLDFYTKTDDYNYWYSIFWSVKYANSEKIM